MHEPGEFQCPMCEKKFSQKWDLLQHQEENHKVKGEYQCDLCEKSFSVKTKLLKHKRHIHGISKKVKNKCNVCLETFTSMVKLKNHEMNIHNIKRVSKIACKDCDKVYTSNQMLKIHTAKYHSYFCKICDITFDSSYLFGSHKFIIHHGDETEMKFEDSVKCGQCEETFSSKESLRSHRSEFHKDHQCNDCEKAFLSVQSLKAHLMSHEFKDYVASIRYVYFKIDFPLEFKVFIKLISSETSFNFQVTFLTRDFKSF